MPIDASIYSQLDTQAPERIAGIIQQNLDPMASMERAARLGDVLNKSRQGNMQMQAAQAAAQREQAAHAALASPEGKAAMNNPDPEVRYAKMRALLGPYIPGNDLDNLLTSFKPAPVQFAPAGSQPYQDGKAVGDAIPKEQPPSNLSKLIAERDALPANAPQRKTYENAIRKESETARQISPVISVGGPTIPTLTPNGRKIYSELAIQGKLPPGYGRWGMAERNNFMNDEGEKRFGSSGTGESIAGEQANASSNKAALGAITKDLAAITPYKEMLDTNADIAVNLAGKILKTNSALANKSLTWLAQNMSDNPDVAEFMAQNHFVTTESARVLTNPRLVGQLTDSAIKDMQAVVNGNAPLSSYVRVMQRIKADGNNRINAMQKERDTLAGSFGKRSTDSPTKTITNDDIAATARASGKPVAVVKKAFEDKGYTVK